MTYKNFEDYLLAMHVEENPELLDDDLPDNYPEWLGSLEPEDFIRYGTKYGLIMKMQGYAQIMKDLESALPNLEEEIND